MTGFRILTVCTGNICRSPLAEQLLRIGAAGWPAVTVESAGTAAMVGYPMEGQAQALSRKHGGDPSHHAARRLTGEQVRSAGLVFAMARVHRRAIAELVPRASRYTFTLREFARLVDGVADADFGQIARLSAVDAAGRLGASVELAASRRGSVDLPEHPGDDDVIDPYGGDDETYELSARQIVPAVDAVRSYLSRAVTVGAK